MDLLKIRKAPNKKGETRLQTEWAASAVTGQS